MTLARWLRSVFAPRPAARTRPPARCLAVECLEDRLTPSTGGALDPTFGSGGHVLSSFSNYLDLANAVTVQPDGKIVVAGISLTSGSKTADDFLVARYNADGSVDTSFGTGGRTVTDFNRGYDEASAVALQPQTSGPSKILVAGMVQRNGNDDFGLARYNANGTLDTTFGTKGKVETDLGGSIDWAQSMVVDSAGRILVAGYTTATGSGFVAALVRYTANGALDTTFGSGGKLITNIRLPDATHADVVALQTDGKIVLAGTTIDPATSSWEFVVARFNANGTADTGFGSGGVVTTHPGAEGDSFGGVTIQGDGKIVVSGSEASGSSPSALYLLRYNADGTLDATFGTGGVVAVASPGAPGDGGIDAHRSGVVVQSDGKIVAGGQYYDSTAQQEVLAALRVNPDGSVDTSYGHGGWATVQFAFADSLEAIALEPDGQLLLAGYAQPTSNSYPTDVALVRFLGSAPQIGSFTASPNPVTAGSSVTLTATNLTDGNPNSSITQVAFYLDSNNDGTLETTGTNADTLLGYATQTSPGVWTLTNSSTFGLTTGTYTLFAQAEDSDGVFGDPVALTLTVL